jgi:hypothetical protein
MLGLNNMQDKSCYWRTMQDMLNDPQDHKKKEDLIEIVADPCLKITQVQKHMICEVSNWETACLCCPTVIFIKFNYFLC